MSRCYARPVVADSWLHWCLWGWGPQWKKLGSHCLLWATLATLLLNRSAIPSIFTTYNEECTWEAKLVIEEYTYLLKRVLERNMKVLSSRGLVEAPLSLTDILTISLNPLDSCCLPPQLPNTDTTPLAKGVAGREALDAVLRSKLGGSSSVVSVRARPAPSASFDNYRSDHPS